MTRTVLSLCLVVLILTLLSGCSGAPPADKAQRPSIPLEKILGKAQTLIESGGATDSALNAGGQSVYLWSGPRRYRLFLKTPAEIVHGKHYVAEGIDAQKIIDQIGDPDAGRNGYPLESSCQRVVKAAWPRLSFDAIDSTVGLVKARVMRYPARPLFLVTQVREATPEEISAASPEVAKTTGGAAKAIPEVTVPADKQAVLLLEGAVTQQAPLWNSAGGSVKCEVVIDVDGKVDSLETGAQLCEAVPWATFKYKPTAKAGKPARVRTEVEIRFEPRKPKTS